MPTRCVGAALARGQLLRPNPSGLDRDGVFLNPCRVAARTNASRRPAFGNIESLGSMSSPRGARPATGTVALTYQAHISLEMGGRLVSVCNSLPASCPVATVTPTCVPCRGEAAAARRPYVAQRTGYLPRGSWRGIKHTIPGFPYKLDTGAGKYRGWGVGGGLLPPQPACCAAHSQSHARQSSKPTLCWRG